MTKPNGNSGWRVFLTVCVAAAGAGGIGGFGTNALLSSQFDRLDAERVRNLQAIALNAGHLAEQKAQLRVLEQCIQYIQRDLSKLDAKMDKLLKALE